MTIIITMAGAGSRFRSAGYQMPKYMIEVKGRTLFEWSLESLSGYKNDTRKYLFIVQKEDHASGFIKDCCSKLSLFPFEIVEIDALTDGQATTCMLAMPKCNPSKPILIYNIDTYVEPGELRYETLRGDGHIPCFLGEGDHWSFVRLNQLGNAAEVREKKRISQYCTLGAYYFSSATLFERLYTEYYSCESHIEKNEKFVAPLYNYMIEKNLTVTVSVVDKNKVHILGTPEELTTFQEL